MTATQADPMNDPSTQFEIPPCSICQQPGTGAWIFGDKGQTHCDHPDCESKVHQLANPDAIHWRFDEPWPSAPKPNAPAVESVGGGGAQAPAGAAPPAFAAPGAEHPRWALERRKLMPVPKAPVSPANLPPPADLAAARQELQEAFGMVLRGDGSGPDAEVSARLASLLVALREQHEILGRGVELLRAGHSLLEVFAWMLAQGENLRAAHAYANGQIEALKRLTSR